MKHFTTLIAFLLVAGSSLAVIPSDSIPYQRQDSEHVKDIMKAWDAEKGEWMYESLAALVMYEKQPERPENMNETPFEVLQSMDNRRVDRLEKIATEELRKERNLSNSDEYYWETWRSYLRLSKCDVNNGQSNGDPHFTTFEGQKFNFQNAGDHLLTASENQLFMIQTQQVRVNSSVAVNKAVSLYMNGDIVEFYSRPYPKEAKGNMIRVNGEPFPEVEADIILPQGGVIRHNNGRYTANWPTGEQASISTRTFNYSELIDIKVFVPKCGSNYIGLLGNNDGLQNDIRMNNDSSNRVVQSIEPTHANLFGRNRKNKETVAQHRNNSRFISRKFGPQFQLDSTTSLFSFQMTTMPDSIRFPKEYLSLAQIEDQKIEEGLRLARKAGVSEENLFGAVYDYGYLDLQPAAYNTDYQRKKEQIGGEEPELNKTGDGLKGERNQIQNRQIRISPVIIIGTTIGRTLLNIR